MQIITKMTFCSATPRRSFQGADAHLVRPWTPNASSSGMISAGGKCCSAHRSQTPGLTEMRSRRSGAKNQSLTEMTERIRSLESMIKSKAALAKIGSNPPSTQVDVSGDDIALASPFHRTSVPPPSPRLRSQSGLLNGVVRDGTADTTNLALASDCPPSADLWYVRNLNFIYLRITATA